MNKEFHKKQNFFSFSDIDSERKDRIMKFTSTEATPAPHVPPGVLRLTGAAKEDIPMYRTVSYTHLTLPTTNEV